MKPFDRILWLGVAAVLGKGTRATLKISALLIALCLNLSAATDTPIKFGSIKDNNHFSDPDQQLSGAEIGDFQLGNALFRKLWSVSSSSVKSADGAGPLFNSRSCQRCHLKDGRGNPPSDDQSTSASLVFQLKKSQQDPLIDKTYGQQIQPFAANGLHGEANIFVRFEREQFAYPDGKTIWLNRPHYRVENLAYGKLEDDTVLAPRVAPAMIGLGLLQAISTNDIKAAADPEDDNQDGISGRTNFGYSLENQRTMLGRFGWKASAPTIIDQSAVAFSVDMGLSTPLLNTHYGDCTEQQTECRRVARVYAQDANKPEVSRDVLELVAHYSANLAVPEPRNITHPDFAAGKQLFDQINCQACHIPQHTTGSNGATPEHLRNRIVNAYTDLLLHDMGAELSDTQRQGFAFATEWRTTPLWGVGLTQSVNPQARFLHDGRATSIEEAIIWHGGEAQSAKEAFTQLSETERQKLLFFLNSL